DGLAAGKGVFVCSSIAEAQDSLAELIEIYGADADYLIEEKLIGQELSLLAFTDGKHYQLLLPSQDHKQLLEDDKGPNTGGMGAYSPAPVITKGLEKDIMKSIIRPLIKGLKKEKIQYWGVIYAGLMICGGKPYVLEFNCRFGDPEAQPVLMRLKSDLFDALKAAADGRLNDVKLSWRKDTSVCVVLASKGYPGSYEKGKTINGLDSVKGRDNLMVFHAGTDMYNGGFVTSGGRVLGVTALGKDTRDAKTTAYEAIRKIHFEGMHYRKDIADKAIKR
ncbi:MAG: phosphoribosylamine--glycine ligase, partial [Thermodesulfovibrionia bacterium]|nr:phosphoribosylamine--glycine ligase [Thermodesulfovibrionia bacterium]